MNLALLVPVVSFAAAAVLTRGRVRWGCLAVALVLAIVGGVGGVGGAVGLWVAALGPLTATVVAVLSGNRRWSVADRVAVAVGAAGALAVLVVAVAGADGALNPVGCVAALLVVTALGVGSPEVDPGRQVRTVWVALAAGTCATPTALALLLGDDTALRWWASAASAAVPAGLVLAVRGSRRIDVRRTTAAAVVHGVTALGVLAAYSGVSAVVVLLTDDVPRGPVPTVLLLACAAGYGPLRAVLRPHVEALLFGRRLDPLPVLADLGRELQHGTTTSWLPALTRGCGLPWAELTADGVLLARTGSASMEPLHRNDLRMDGQVVGELVVGVDPLAGRLPRETELVLALLATPLAHAVRSARLAADLQRARERTAAARDDERRRLGAELHDGLGAALTGLGYSADAALRMLHGRPEDAEPVLRDLRDDAHDALAKVRRIVAGMRPAELDDGGLLPALTSFCERYRSAGLDVELSVGSLPVLPADVEVAVHRVVTEAVTNAARHSDAHHVGVSMSAAAGELLVLVTDDAGPSSRPWDPGNGLSSMHARADRLGGRLSAGPNAAGGRVELRLPLAAQAAVVPEIVAEPSTWVPR